MKKLLVSLCSVSLFVLCLFPSSVSAQEVEVKVDESPPVEDVNEEGEGVINIAPVNVEVLMNPWQLQSNEEIFTLHKLKNDGNPVFSLSLYETLEDGIVLNNCTLQEEWKTGLTSLLQVYSQQEINEEYYQSIQLLIWEKCGIFFTFLNATEQAIFETHKAKINADIANLLWMPTLNENITLQMSESKAYANEVGSMDNIEIQKEDSAIILNQEQQSLYSSSNVMRSGTIRFSKALTSSASILYYDEMYQFFTPSTTSIQKEVSYAVQSYGRIHVEAIQELPQQITMINDTLDIQYGYYPLQCETLVYANEDIYDVWNHLLYQKGTLVTTFTQDSMLLPSGVYEVKVNGVDEQDCSIITIGKEEESIPTYQVNAIKYQPLSTITMTKSWENIEDVLPYSNYALYNAEDILDGAGNVILPKDSQIHSFQLQHDEAFSIHKKLPYGNYYVKEVEPFPTYQKDEQRYDFQIDGLTSPSITLTKAEKVKHDLTIFVNQKGRGIAATFALYDKDQELIDTFTSDDSGEIAIAQLPEDTYYVKQKEVPEEYQLQNTMEEITLTQDTTLDMQIKKVATKTIEENVISTNDNANHKPMEVMMLASLLTMYYLGFKKLRKL